MKLFPANISERATLQKLGGNSAVLPANVDRRPPFRRVFMNFLLYNKSLKDWSLRKQIILFLSNLNVSQKSKLTVSLGTSH